MRTAQRTRFFSRAVAARKSRKRKPQEIIKHTGNMLELPNEIWLEILKFFNKKQLRDISPVNSFFHKLIAVENLFAKALWPIPDYEKLLFKKSWHAATGGGIFTLPNGDVVVATDNGNIWVLELGRSEWHKYGQHKRELRGVVVYHCVLLSSGLLATVGDDGLRLWNTKMRKEIQFLSVSELGSAAKLYSVYELSNGNLVAVSNTMQFHLWRKTAWIRSPYEYSGILFDENDETIECMFRRDAKGDVIVTEGKKYIMLAQLKNGVELKRIEVAVLRRRLAQTMQALRRDPAFVATHLFPWDLEMFNETAYNLERASFESDLDIWLTLPEVEYIAVGLNGIEFLLNPFEDTMTPIYLGRGEIKTTKTGDIIFCRDTLQGVEFLSGFDTKTNTFKHAFKLPLLAEDVKLLDDGHALIIESGKLPFIYDIYSRTKLHEFHLKLPDDIEMDVVDVIMKLRNGDLLGCYYSEERSEHYYLIWDFFTGALKNIFSGGGEVTELHNGDLLTYHARDKPVDVVRFGVK